MYVCRINLPLLHSSTPGTRHTAFAYLQLLRPANIVTAIADILAGFAISGSVAEIFNTGNGWLFIPEWKSLLWLMLSAAGLYGGGVVFNDFFDAELDKAERPERPIPSGRASRRGAGILGTVLLLIGIVSAFQVSFASVILAASVACLALLYDVWGKHQSFFGPLNMGLCRGGNLLLGVSIAEPMLSQRWFIAVIPVIYIAAVTLVSRGEVHGKNNRSLQAAGSLYALTMLLVAGLGLLPVFYLRSSLVFLLFFGMMIYAPLRKAQQSGLPQDIGKAVKFGVLGLILMDAAVAAGFLGWDYALPVAALLPVSVILAKVFAVT